MLTAYIDESQTREKVPVVAVGGGVGTGKQWTRLLEAWRKALDTEPRVKIFHTCEFETPEGRLGTVYEKWSKQRRERFHNALIGAIKDNQLEVSMAATLPISEFEKVKPAMRLTRGKYGDAFYFCAFMLIEQIAIYSRRTFGGDHRVTYYFEQGGPHQSRLERAYAEITNDDRVKKRYRMWLAPTFAPKDSQPGLQVADKLLYEAAKHASHFFDDDPPERFSGFHPEEKRKMWHDRYPTKEMILSGLDVHARWYDAKELAEFYKKQDIKVTVEKRKDFITSLVSKAKRKAKREAKRAETK